MASEGEANAAAAAATEDAPKENWRQKGKHDKPKPWDEDPNIDHWKLERFDPWWNEGGMLDVTSFSTLFPQYREKYLQEAWPIVKGALNDFGVSCELNLVKGSMTVSTTRKTTDPFIIFKARDLIKLLSRSVPAPQELLIKRELAKVPALATESWDRFLPKFKKKNVKQKKPHQTKEKKPYMPFPPPQQPSKIDLELESGEYFMSDKKKSAQKWQEKLEKQAENL
ncbi:hypothetical protein QOZ80_1BG0080930 [Eleusine coracana subsp. coracana]|nr:hypothetical protein QOZ80_1BG0080930 [Eleusine coracana subsp. coracana]